MAQKVFTYRGKTVEELQKMDLKEFFKMGTDGTNRVDRRKKVSFKYVPGFAPRSDSKKSSAQNRRTDAN